jgi:two-component system chemotaxis response regulator CheY
MMPPLVDDATFIRKIVKNVLEPRGFDIVGEAVSGEEAVRKYNQLRPDPVTMGMDTNARVIMVTALGQEKMLMEALRIGVKDFVVKPFESERLLAAVERALA